jgi:thiamine-monophosphate kinase
MGAVPTALVVALAAPADLEVAWAQDLSRGLAAACAPTGAGIVGGDLSVASEVVVSVTVLGDLGGRAPVRRDGARPGDVVAVAGTLGRSAAGLALLQSGRTGLAPELVEVHRRPRPPLDAGPAAADAGATAMIDVSDGLLLDLGRVADASGVTLDLDPAALRPFTAPLLAAAGGDAAAALAWVLGGGEDHALAACFPAGTTLPDDFTPVGAVLPRRDDVPVLLAGELPPGTARGWDHFA